MSSHCKIEFYFKSADLLKLLMENKEAKGVIVSQEITQKTWPDGKRTNVALITARMEQPTQTLTSQSTGDAEIYGCPFPPGCTE